MGKEKKKRKPGYSDHYGCLPYKLPSSGPYYNSYEDLPDCFRFNPPSPPLLVLDESLSSVEMPASPPPLPANSNGNSENEQIKIAMNPIKKHKPKFTFMSFFVQQIYYSKCCLAQLKAGWLGAQTPIPIPLPQARYLFTCIPYSVSFISFLTAL